MKATVVLVHGAYAESSSWEAVVESLLLDFESAGDGVLEDSLSAFPFCE